MDRDTTLHQTAKMFRESWNQRARRGHSQGVGSSSEGHNAPRFFSHLSVTWNAVDRSIVRSTSSNGCHLSRRTPIDVRSWPDRHHDQAQSWPYLKQNQSHDHRRDRGHHPTIRPHQMASKSGGNPFLKSDVFSL